MVDTESELTLFLCGDVMLGRGIDQAFEKSCPSHLYESYVKDARDYIRIAEEKSGMIKTPLSYDYVWGDALEEFQRRKVGLKIINLETAVTLSEDAAIQKGIHYRMHPQNES